MLSDTIFLLLSVFLCYSLSFHVTKFKTFHHQRIKSTTSTYLSKTSSILTNLTNDILVPEVAIEIVNGHKLFIPSPLKNASPEESWAWYENKRIKESILKSAIASNVTDIQSYFAEYESYLSTDKAEILSKNDLYYESLSKGDITAMKSIWCDSNETLLVQAGKSTVVTGYRNIINWLAQMNQDYNGPKPTLLTRNVTLNYQGNIAVVSSTIEYANVSQAYIARLKKLNKYKDKLLFVPYYATNIFMKATDSDTYVLIAHIGSLKLQSDSKEAQTLQLTYTDPTRIEQKPANNRAVGTISLQDLFRSQQGGGRRSIMGMVGDDEDEDEDDNLDDDDDQDDDDNDDDDDNNNDDDDDDDDDDSEGEESYINSVQKKITTALTQALYSKLGKNLGSKNGNKNIVVIRTNSWSKNDDNPDVTTTFKSIQPEKDKNNKILSNDDVKSIIEDATTGSSSNSNNNKQEQDHTKQKEGTSKSMEIQSDKKPMKKMPPRMKYFVHSTLNGEEEDYDFNMNDDDNDNSSDTDDDDNDSDFSSFYKNSRLSKSNKLLDKMLAAQTLNCVKYLHENNRLTTSEKNILVNDIITNAASNEYAKVEVAFSLLIGPGLPDEMINYKPESDSGLLPNPSLSTKKRGIYKNVEDENYSIQTNSILDDEEEEEEDDDDENDEEIALSKALQRNYEVTQANKKKGMNKDNKTTNNQSTFKVVEQDDDDVEKKDVEYEYEYEEEDDNDNNSDYPSFLMPMTDMASKIAIDDMKDFEDMCHFIATELCQE